MKSSEPVDKNRFMLGLISPVTQRPFNNNRSAIRVEVVWNITTLGLIFYALTGRVQPGRSRFP